MMVYMKLSKGRIGADVKEEDQEKEACRGRDRREHTQGAVYTCMEC